MALSRQLLLLVLVLGILVSCSCETYAAAIFSSENAYPFGNSSLNIPIFVSTLSSPRTLLSYSYYDKIRLCKPTDSPKAKTNLGDAILGTELQPSYFKIPAPIPGLPLAITCAPLCPNDTYISGTKELVNLIKGNYNLHWYDG